MSRTDIYVDDVIGKSDDWGGGISAKVIRDMLDDVPDGEDVRLRINSEGGSVFEASAILSALRQRGPFDVLVDGLAASAASYIAMGGRQVEMAEGSWMMIHNPMGIAYGNYKDMEKMASDLARFAGKYAAVYANRTGMPEDEVQALMDEETFLTDEEAVSMGFADSIADDVQAQEKKIAACFLPGGKRGWRHDPPNVTHRMTDAAKARAQLARFDIAS